MAVFGEPRTVCVPCGSRKRRLGASVQDLASGRTVRVEIPAAEGVLVLDVAELKAAVVDGKKSMPAVAVTVLA